MFTQEAQNKKKIDLDKLRYPEIKEKYERCIKSRFEELESLDGVEEKWKIFKEVTIDGALEICGTLKKDRPFDESKTTNEIRAERERVKFVK